jgi:hypothetical protein
MHAVTRVASTQQVHDNQRRLVGHVRNTISDSFSEPPEATPAQPEYGAGII